ncbi:hypothetical protein ENUP19_0247G0011 [Entamoeba nuttalli]|uniref:Uncharacterized protein n=2 Tax=Entamoeba nuttalli TaxID=412467 RepID=K2HPE1_ENTNP|nr:hypothetical protein ENU1_187840 [Entamoeba nuttalli P19]EKE37735.1 hypothetical protein ENU1_187840 [Entamoeba nuttalli P19]|eukprot:XP_008859933.1 hypothetical protein ENU1_187840 [Entamoeba nuttalli P19]
MDTLHQNNPNTQLPHTATPLTLMSEEEKKLKYFKTQLFQPEFTDEAYSMNMTNITKLVFGKKDPETSLIESAFKEYTNTVNSNKQRLVKIDKMIFTIRTYLHLPSKTEQDIILKKKIEKYLTKINENKEAKEFKLKFDEYSKLVSCQNIGKLPIEQQKKVMEAVSFLWPYERDRRKQIEIWEEDIGKIYYCLSMDTNYYTKIDLKDQLKTLKRIYERFFTSENYEEEYERAINMQKKVWNLNNTTKKYLMKITSLLFSIKLIPKEYNQLLLSILKSYKQRINQLHHIYITCKNLAQYQWSLISNRTYYDAHSVSTQLYNFRMSLKEINIELTEIYYNVWSIKERILCIGTSRQHDIENIEKKIQTLNEEFDVLQKSLGTKYIEENKICSEENIQKTVILKRKIGQMLLNTDKVFTDSDREAKIKVELSNLTSIEKGCKKRCDILNKMINGEKELNPVDDVSVFIEYELLDVEFLSIMKFCRGDPIYIESSSESSEISSDSVNSINDNGDGSVIMEKKEKITSSSEDSDSSINCNEESGSIVIKKKKEDLTSSSEDSIVQI